MIWRSVLLVASTAVLAAGCVPVQPTTGRRPRMRDRQPDPLPGVVAVRVPARLGQEVQVRRADLNRLDPTLGRHAELEIRFRGQRVKHQRLQGGTLLAFRVTHQNRHSPFLVYTITPARVAARTPAEDTLPTGLTFQARPHRQLASWRQLRAIGRARLLKALGLRRDMDYLMIAPRALLAELEPLRRHREKLGHRVGRVALEDLLALLSGGNPDPDGLARAVGVVHRLTGSKLRYLLLVGDCEKGYRPKARAATPLPAFYRRKLVYPGFSRDNEFPTDHPYSTLPFERRGMSRIGLGLPRVAVGRIPARTPAELRAYVRKVIRYETREPSGTWQRRLALFTGPAGLSATIDKLLETVAMQILDQSIPYRFDLTVIFAKKGSPYAYRFDRLSQHIVKVLNQGALVAAYVGHGRPDSFDSVSYGGRYYRLGNSASLRQVRIPAGKPFFLSITCHNGSFDRPGGRPSISELLMLNPKGPIATFGSSRVSHPYPNLLYIQAFVAQFMGRRPRTLGEGVVAMKRGMSKRRVLLARLFVRQDHGALKAEHRGLYNLFGDPGIRLRYPETLRLRVGPARGAAISTTFRPGQRLVATAWIPRGTKRARVTVEVRRKVMRHRLKPITAAMPLAKRLETLAENWHKAQDKIVSLKSVAVQTQTLRVTLNAPTRPGSYVVKVFVHGGPRSGAAHAGIRVR